ncbi:MAG TPA: SsrA-binding protein SmpB [Candidatus Baltobacteraceae bacterium]|jgi:SsrA-binding protein|nr:SsrA-binding protein SmpB [Candidatus Baltobacteraceae bacterium]
MAAPKPQPTAKTGSAKSSGAKPPALEPKVENRRAHFEFEFLEQLEAGIVLTGTEVKSIRVGGANLAQSFARVRDGEIWLLGMHIAPYRQGSFSNHEPTRPRKLLVARKDINRLADLVGTKGLTLLPVRMYFKRGIVKISLALARGKKLWDKRRSLKERDAQRDMARDVRGR